MATAHVKTVSGDWSTGSTLAISPTSFTGGNLLVVSVHYGTGNTSTTFATVDDGGTNTYTLIDQIEASVAGIIEGVATLYAYNITGGTLTITATMTGSSMSQARIIVEEVSGALAASDPLDVHTGQHLSGASGTDAVTSGSAGSAAAGDFVYAATFAYFDNGETLAPGTTPTYSNTDVANTAFYGSEYIAAFAGGAIAGNFTATNGSAEFYTAVATFKVGGAAPPSDSQEWLTKTVVERSRSSRMVGY